MHFYAIPTIVVVNEQENKPRTGRCALATPDREVHTITRANLQTRSRFIIRHVHAATWMPEGALKLTVKVKECYLRAGVLM